ncbi:MAG: hypothetical protein ACKORY_06185, partial [Actinomycetota bacterium]
MILAAAMLTGCGGGSADPAQGGAETTVPGDPEDKGTVPTDPSSYEAQEWATFQLVELPTRYFEKYSPWVPLVLTDRTWPNKTIDKAPLWCSVD